MSRRKRKYVSFALFDTNIKHTHCFCFDLSVSCRFFNNKDSLLDIIGAKATVVEQ